MLRNVSFVVSRGSNVRKIAKDWKVEVYVLCLLCEKKEIKLIGKKSLIKCWSHRFRGFFLEPQKNIV